MIVYMESVLSESDIGRIKLSLDVYISTYRDNAERAFAAGRLSVAERNSIMVHLSRFEKTREIIVDIQKGVR